MLRVFPIAAPARFSDDFGYIRSEGAKPHAGIDIFADEGSPLVAVDAGQVRFGQDPIGGNIANLYAEDGTRYYYAHLYAFAGGGPRSVEAGEVIGYVGDTGNAQGGPPHVHFEEHPGNGAAVNPHAGLLAAAHSSAGSRSGGPSAGKVVLAIGLLGALAFAVGPTIDKAMKQAARSPRTS